MREQRRERPDRPRVAPPRAGAQTLRKAPERAAARPATRRSSHGAVPAGGHGHRPRPAASRPKRPRPAAAKRPASSKVRRRRSKLVTLLVALVLLGFLFVFVYPTRTYLHQRRQIQVAQERLAVLRRETAAIERDTARLATDAEVERIAREQYGLIRENETPFVLVPQVTPPAEPAAPAPAAEERKVRP